MLLRRIFPLTVLFLLLIVSCYAEGECDASADQCANPETVSEPEGEDPNCPSRPYVIRCAAEYLDTNKNGRITEIVFRKIMSGKLGEEAFEVEEMLAEYKRIHVHNVPPTPDGEEYIDYKKFVAMLQK